MKKEDIDTLIKESLSNEDADFYNQLDEPGMFKQWGNIYTSKLGGWAVLLTFFQLIFTVLAVWLGVEFFTSEVSDSQLMWGAGLFMSLIAVSQIKMWHWMQMDKNTILQEMKRIEFQIAILTEKISEES